MTNLDIKEIRNKLQLSQEDFAEMLGVHSRTVQNWEAGKKIPASKYALLRNILNPQSQNVTGYVVYQIAEVCKTLTVTTTIKAVTATEATPTEDK